MEILKVENLVKTYGKGETKINAVDDISFTINKGEFVAIVGASGSGKSTLLHLIGGVDRPTSGKVYIDGKDIYALNNDNLAIFRRRQIGLIYQFYNLIPILNVEENITLPCDLDGCEIDKKRLQEMLKTLGLENRRTHLPNQLSGGQQQRVSIGRAMINNPAIMTYMENIDDKVNISVLYNEPKEYIEINKNICANIGLNEEIDTYVNSQLLRFLGLSLAKTIIEQNNGYIKATSEVGKGTLFEIKYIK